MARNKEDHSFVGVAHPQDFGRVCCATMRLRRLNFDCSMRRIRAANMTADKIG